MKQIFTFGLVAAVAVTTSANAGWRDLFGLNKTTEPTTLAEACNTDEITSICPEMIMGSKTMMECLSDNISSLSSKCAGFVKKQIAAGVDNVAKSVEETKAATNETVEGVKSDVATAKAEGETAVKEVETSAKETGEAAKETGGFFKRLFN